MAGLPGKSGSGVWVQREVLKLRVFGLQRGLWSIPFQLKHPSSLNTTTACVACCCLLSAHDVRWKLWCLQADLKRRADELEKKTAGVDLLNRKADKIRAAQDGGPETGGAVYTTISMYVTICMHITDSSM